MSRLATCCASIALLAACEVPVEMGPPRADASVPDGEAPGPDGGGDAGGAGADSGGPDPYDRWPAAPTVRVRMRLRDRAPEEVERTAPERWVREEGWRWSEERSVIGDVALFVWREQWEGYDATRVTVALVNGFADRGVAYFHELEVRVDGEALFELSGRHVIVPRGILARRTSVGADAEQLALWEMIRHRLPSWTPSFAGPAFEEALALVRAAPHWVGPYNIGDPIVRHSSSLDGSHGGWKIGLWGGGSESWHLGAVESWRYAEENLFRTIARSPIAVLERETIRPYNPGAEYWLGRTLAHELPGFREAPDEWSRYAQELHQFRPHAYTHLWRQIRDAAMLARHDAAARWFLLTSWHDCLLWLESGGRDAHVSLLWPLDALVERTPPHRGAPWGGRGFAHVVRCFLEAEPYLPAEHAASWRARLVAALRHVIVPGTGVAHGNDQPDPVDPTMIPPVARAREADLLGASFLRLGMLEEDADWRRFMASAGGDSVSEGFEIRPGQRSWREHRHSTPSYFPGYDAFRCDLSPYGGTRESLLAEAALPGWPIWHRVHENPLDWTDPACWR